MLIVRWQVGLSCAKLSKILFIWAKFSKFTLLFIFIELSFYSKRIQSTQHIIFGKVLEGWIKNINSTPRSFFYEVLCCQKAEIAYIVPKWPTLTIRMFFALIAWPLWPDSVVGEGYSFQRIYILCWDKTIQRKTNPFFCNKKTLKYHLTFINGKMKVFFLSFFK